MTAIFKTKMAEAQTAVEAALVSLNAAYDHTPNLARHGELDAMRARMLEIVVAVRNMSKAASRPASPSMLQLKIGDELFHEDIGDASYKAVVTSLGRNSRSGTYTAVVDVFMQNGDRWVAEDTVHLETDADHSIGTARFWREIIHAVQAFYVEH